jgi:hypothetical protein
MHQRLIDALVGTHVPGDLAFGIRTLAIAGFVMGYGYSPNRMRARKAKANKPFRKQSPGTHRVADRFQAATPDSRHSLRTHFDGNSRGIAASAITANRKAYSYSGAAPVADMANPKTDTGARRSIGRLINHFRSTKACLVAKNAQGTVRAADRSVSRRSDLPSACIVTDYAVSSLYRLAIARGFDGNISVAASYRSAGAQDEGQDINQVSHSSLGNEVRLQ